MRHKRGPMPSMRELILGDLRIAGRSEVDPRHVEAFMHLAHPTLDLTPDEFEAAVTLAIEWVDRVGTANAEALASGLGLR